MIITLKNLLCRRLETSVKMEKFRQLSAQELPDIWAAHFAEKPGNLGVSMPAALTSVIKSRLAEYPMFILPISRLTGHEIVLLESVVGDNFTVQVTGLEEYKTLGPQAPIRASFSFFTELQAEKDLTLIHGKFDGSQMNLSQSSLLLQNLCAAYSRDELFKWIREFRDRPAEFDFNGFMKTFTSASASE